MGSHASDLALGKVGAGRWPAAGSLVTTLVDVDQLIQHVDRVAGYLDYAKEYGAKRAIPLNVSAPFHCELMAPAADVMAEALAGVEISAPKVPVVANVVAEGISDPGAIRQRLVEQVTGQIPLQRLGRPEDIASTALFLASEESSFFTGQLLHPDGGLFTG